MNSQQNVCTKTNVADYSLGNCPVCGGSVVFLDDRYVCTTELFGTGCNFRLELNDIQKVLSDNIVELCHGIVLTDDYINEQMRNLLDCGKGGSTWYDTYGIYESYELRLRHHWTVEVVRDNAELEAEAKENYRKMQTEG